MPFPLGPPSLRAPTVAEREHDAEKFHLLSPFRWVSADRQRSHTVLPGARTDFASFPHWMPFSTTLLGDPHTVAAAAIIHDDLYGRAGFHAYSREQTDAIFLEILLEIGVRRWRARLMYWGVRIGGGRAWSDYVEQNTRPDAGSQARN